MSNLKDKNLIILSESPFSQRDYDRFRLEYFIQNGFQVKIYDFNQFLFPQVNKIYSKIEFLLHEQIRYFHIDSLWAFLDHFMTEPEGSKVFLLIGYSAEFIQIYNAIRKRKFYSFGYQLNMTPVSRPSVKYTYMLSRTTGFRKYLNFKKIAYIFLNRIYLRYFFDFYINLYIVSGTRLRFRFPINSQTVIIKGHSHDYDYWYSNKSKTPIAKDYIVFIDQMAPFHPDVLRAGMRELDPEEYYQSLRVFFDALEAKTGFQLTIAAHPRSDDQKNKLYFGNRTVKKNETLALIAKSALVVSHGSTATAWAVLCRKPMIMLNMDCFLGTYHSQQVIEQGKMLRCPIINANHFSEKDLTIPPIDEEFYLNYEFEHLRQKDSLEGNTFENICNYLIKIN